MDKQQFDHIDNRIRQAADEISVSFNEEAWKKMEVKLDNEFNKDRRRGIIWWRFSFMLLGIAVAGIYVYNHKPFVPSKNIASNSSLANNKPSLHKNDVANTNKPINRSNIEQKADASYTDKNNETVSVKKVPDSLVNSPLSNSSARLSNEKIKTKNKLVASNNPAGLFRRNHTRKSTSSAVRAKDIKSVASIKLKGAKDNYNRANDLTGNSHDKKAESSNNLLNEPRLFLDSLTAITANKNEKKPEAVIQNDSLANVQNDSLANTNSVGKKKTQIKLDNTSSKGFYLLASVSGEATGIKNISIKDTKPFYGLGIGYRFNKRLSVQTGFYFGNKMYFAGANDYKLKPGSYVAKLIGAEAECYIYDIPVTLRYDVLHKERYNLYFTTGISSIILKSETYDMHFFNSSGMYHRMTYTYKHHVGYFSILNLSLGYEHQLSKALSVQAEPYLKLPLSGLGEGSVKLYSAGLQVSVKYNLLKKKKY